MKVSSVAQMRAMDRQAVETFGIPEEILMTIPRSDAGVNASFSTPPFGIAWMAFITKLINTWLI